MWILPLLIVGVSVLLSIPTGWYLAWIIDGRYRAPRWLRWIERRVDTGPQTWKQFAISLLLFNSLMFVVGFVLLQAQAVLPLNPDHRGTLAPTTVFNTVASFMTNTNLQHYSGEQHLSYFSQVVFVVWNMFVSASVGFCALAAVIRGLRGDTHLGNFYLDMWRVVAYVFIPVSLCMGIFLIARGQPMTLEPTVAVTTVDPAAMGTSEDGKLLPQMIARGPVAAIVPIKHFGTNGGGFFGANSAHPFENPDAWSNFLTCINILLFPFSLVVMFGTLLKNQRHAAVIYCVMMVMFVAMIGWAIRWDTLTPNPAITAHAAVLDKTGVPYAVEVMDAEGHLSPKTVDVPPLAGLPVDQTLGNLEGKELRFGTSAGATFAAVTTAVTCGSVNCMHDSLNPLAGITPLAGMWLNCVFGGKGVGVINMLVFVIIGVFLAGLMVGRTPEYLGKKVEAREMKLAMLAFLIHPIMVLGPTGLFAALDWGIKSTNNPGAHGFSEILYEFSSASANNGSGFEGLSDTYGFNSNLNPAPFSPAWDIATGLVMLISRYVPIIAPLALAASLSRKKVTPFTVGTLRTDTVTFGFVLLGTVLLLGALTFLPAAVLGPVAEHFGPLPLWGLRIRSDLAPPSDRRAQVCREHKMPTSPFAESVAPAEAPSPDELKLSRRASRRYGLFAPHLLKAACKQSFVMLRPDIQWKNPVMFVVEIGALLSIAFTAAQFAGYRSQASQGYLIALDAWLVLTVLFANFATALAEARGKAQADSLRKTRRETPAYRVKDHGEIEETVSTALQAGDRIVVSAGQIIPGDGEIIDGVASVDESAITGESAPVIREAGGDRSGVTGGTRVLSDRIVVEITASAGKSFLDRMIGLVEGATRQRTPNEIALSLVLSAFTLIFLIVTVALWPMALHAELYMQTYLGLSQPLKSLGTDVPTLVGLLVCLIPTTIGALLAAIGIAGMDRALRANVLAKSGKAVEVAGDIDTLLLDKTGTITMGNRRASQFVPFGAYTAAELGQLAAMASFSDQTPEGKSIIELYYELQGTGELQGPGGRSLRVPALAAVEALVPQGSRFVEFTAQTRMSGADLPNGSSIRKGAPDAVIRYLAMSNGGIPKSLQEQIDAVASRGATPLLVCKGNQLAGLIVLEDILKPGMKDRFERLRRMGLRTVMMTGDNPLTAKAIADQAGVDAFIAQATPEAKLDYIRKEQAEGKLVAMMGDGTNDAPALAQADVGVAMNSGTQAAKEAGNMVDLDSDPTKLIEVVEIGKQLLMTRGALTTFSIANDLAKYFAIVPALFAATLPWLKRLDVMHLHSATSAIISAVIFNAIIIPLLIPIALKGVAYKPVGADALLRRNLLLWGLGGVLAPFLGIKLIDVFLSTLHLVA